MFALAATLAVLALGWVALQWLPRADPASVKRWIFILAALALLIAIGLLLTGRSAAVLPLVAATAAAFWRRSLWRRESRRAAATGPTAGMSIEQARAVLGLGPDADHGAVVAAHRKLIRQLHPDKGGSEFLSSQINRARDVLLKHRAFNAVHDRDQA